MALLEMLIDLFDLIGKAVSGMGARAMLIALVALMVSAAVVAVVIAR
jgi:hypothetical protein